jgi:hypothetical protein
MHPYIAIKELVAPIFQRSRHQQVAEEIRPDVFGSAYSIFESSRSTLRLVWDGKDGWGYAQTMASGATDDWRDIPCYLTEADLETVPPNQEKIDAFLRAVENAAV